MFVIDHSHRKSILEFIVFQDLHLCSLLSIHFNSASFRFWAVAYYYFYHLFFLIFLGKDDFIHTSFQLTFKVVLFCVPEDSFCLLSWYFQVIVLEKVFLLDKKLEVRLIFGFFGNFCKDFPVVSSISHWKWKRIFEFSNSIRALFHLLPSDSSQQSASLYPLVVDDLKRDDFRLLAPR